MGNTLSKEEKKSIISKTIEYYEKKKKDQLSKQQLVDLVYEKIECLISTPDVELDLNYNNIDGYIQKDKYILIGWNNDNEDINLEALEETLNKLNED